MIANNDKAVEDFSAEKDVTVVCPKCKSKKDIRIPIHVINQAKQLTTISIPSGTTCKHSYQAFVDKNFKVRMYQPVDFEFSKVEILESTQEEALEDETEEETMARLTALSIFNDIIQILRESVDDVEILGSGLFTLEGRVLYSSLPKGTLTNVMREFEARSEKKLTQIKKMFLELENNEKICSKYMELESSPVQFVLVLFFSEKVKLGMGNLYLREMSRKISKIDVPQA